MVPGPSYFQMLLFIGVSLMMHVAAVALMPPPKVRSKAHFQKVSVQIQTKAEAPKAPEAPPKPEAEAPKPKPQPAQKSAKPEPSSKPTPPVQGLSKESFAPDDGSARPSFSAGNSLMVPDTGKRLTPEEVRKLDADLSEDAKLLIDSFVKPPYTPEAEDAGLEGSFAIEVFVNTKGDVVEAELVRKVGYGMDERLIQSAMKARFSPRKDARGQALEGWTTIKIRLTLE